MPATFIDIMIRRFRTPQVFPVKLTAPEPAPAKPTGPAPKLSATPSAPTLPPGQTDLHRSVRDRSYFLWKEAGEPEGRAGEFWRRSLDEHLAQRAREIWTRQGKPSGKDDDHWYEACRDLERAGLL